jgi:hypothetical protein
MPLERDEGEYAYAGQLILNLVPPYELVYNMKLPGTYYAYALGMAMFGQTSTGVHLTLLLANSLTIAFVFLLGRKLFGTTAGLVACASYGVMSISPQVAGLAAHATNFVVLFAVPATLLLLQTDTDKRAATLFISGLLYGLAFMMIQQGICFCLFGCLYLIWRAFLDKSLLSTGFLKSGLIFGLGIFLPFGLFCASTIIAGNFQLFLFWTFAYGLNYGTMLPWSEGVSNLSMHLQESHYISMELWMLAAAGPLLAWSRKTDRKHVLFVIMFWLFSFLGTAMGLYFRPHYFILTLPAFAILIGLAVASLQRILDFSRLRNVLKTLPLILFGTILSWMVYYQAPVFFFMSPFRACQYLYQMNPFVESIFAANYIREHSPPDARVAVVGSEPEIYFYAHRESATGYIYTYALMEKQFNAPAMQRQMIAEIETNKPEYIVYVPYQLSWLIRPYSDRTIFNWFEKYASKYYDEVGDVGYDKKGEMVIACDETLTNAASISGSQYVHIYRRKPESVGAN